ncbi:MAG: hypothetical protein ACPGZP_03595 [Panacagrimonas sp.]
MVGIFRALSEQPGACPPPSFSELDEADLETLRQSLRAAAQMQSAELDEALTKALDHVPALMRRPLRKILGL